MYPVIMIALLLFAMCAFTAASEEAKISYKNNYTVMFVVSVVALVVINAIENLM